jgi:hypothetical protein
MTQTTEPLYCPHCGARMMVDPEIDIKKPIPCAECEKTSDIAELKTAAGPSIADHAKTMVLDAFKDIPGFKPKR